MRLQPGAPTDDSALGARIVGESRAIAEVREVVQRAAATDGSVLIRGETGTGKDVVARAIHAAGRRAGHPFVKVHCASLPEALLESELFGYERGAFTGASARKPGRLEMAKGGTLFIDEIGDVTPSVQVKLLRVVQDREYERLGGTATLRADVRFIFATHRKLESMVQQREFREDLFYRINVLPIWISPLRTRRDDIELLAAHFLVEAAHGGPVPQFSEDALRRLRRERWPGNARQLRNVIEQVVAFGCQTIITAEDVERALQPAPEFMTEPVSTATARVERQLAKNALARDRNEVERRTVLRALEESQQNRALAARILGISRRTLYNKLAQLGLERDDKC